MTNDSPTPLVTIGVITYNSAKTVLETLESTKAQSYTNLELVISDDCSTDNTVELCRGWVGKNSERFVRCEIITSPVNTGIPANCNRGVRAAHGEWLKGIAGDDILLPNCVDDFVSFSQEHPEAKIIFSYAQEFCGNKDHREFFEKIPDSKNQTVFEKPAEEQFRAFVCSGFWVPAPTCFIKTNLLKKNPYNECYNAMEDLPKWCRLTKAGEKLFFMDKLTILYRINSGGISRHPSTSELFYNTRFMESRKLFFLCELRQHLLHFDMTPQIRKYEREFLLFDLIQYLFKNKRTPFSSFWKHVFSRTLKLFEKQRHSETTLKK